MRKLLIPFIAALVCSCGGDDVKDVNNPNGGEEPSGEKSTLKVMSFNMRNQQSSDKGDLQWEVRKAAVKAMIEEIQPDIIALQEAASASRSWYKTTFSDTYGFRDVPETLISGSGGNTCIMWRTDRFKLVKGGGYFLSATPDLPSYSFNVPDKSWHVTAWIHIQEKETGKDVWAMSTHLPVRTNSSYDNEPYYEARTLSAQLNVKRMKEMAGDKGTCFIAGDMNCSYFTASGATSTSGSQTLMEYTKWLENGRTSKTDKTPAGVYSYNGFGTNTPGSNNNIDFIFYRNATPSTFETITKTFANVPYISDHYPVMLTVEF